MTNLHELSEDECWVLVDQRTSEQLHVARVGWNSSIGPVVIPVNYVVDQRTVWIRTSAYSAMAEEVDESPIAVEVDDIDQESRTGWSVMLRGRAAVLYHEDRVPKHIRDLETLAGGVRPLWVRLDPDHVTGRRLG